CIFQISFITIGSLTMLLVAANNFPFFIVIALCMGLFDGCFISLLGPIAFDIVGPTGASQAIGCLLAMCSIPLTTGPAIAGWLYDKNDSYTIPFLLAGIPPIVGAISLTFIRCIKPPKGAPCPPVKEVSEKQNNAAAVDEPRETHKLMGDYMINGSDTGQESTGIDDIMQVDVRRLATLQRESCV
ncbi:unnamed protein product, partial [Meganyctiphanes norvegica]